MRRLQALIPEWANEWLDIIIPALQIALILLLAYTLHRAIRRVLRRVGSRYHWPTELLVPISGTLRWVIVGGTFLLVLERLGVSATVLWTGFSSFAAVGAVAFFASWSVLSNFFCALLIFTVRPFRLGDYIELLDTADKPGGKGRVVDINMLYTTLEEFDTAQPGTHLQIPNTLIFQRVVRHWQSVPQATPPVSEDSAHSGLPSLEDGERLSPSATRT